MTSPVTAKRGRPRVNVPGVATTTWLREPDYERLRQLARSRETSLSAVMRECLVKQLSNHSNTAHRRRR